MRRIQASEKYMASRSSEKSLPFHFHTGLGHNFNMITAASKNREIQTETTEIGAAPMTSPNRPKMRGLGKGSRYSSSRSCSSAG